MSRVTRRMARMRSSSGSDKVCILPHVTLQWHPSASGDANEGVPRGARNELLQHKRRFSPDTMKRLITKRFSKSDFPYPPKLSETFLPTKMMLKANKQNACFRLFKNITEYSEYFPVDAKLKQGICEFCQTGRQVSLRCR